MVAFAALYHVNGDFIPTNDVTANVQLAMRVLDNRSFSFQSEDHPFMFVWSLDTEKGRRRAMVPAWDLEGPGGATWRELRADGRLKLEKPMYYLVPAVDHERHPVFAHQFMKDFLMKTDLVCCPFLAPEFRFHLFALDYW